MRRAFVLVGCLLAPHLAGVIGSCVTVGAIATWYAGLVKPWFSPPNWVFAPVWMTLYTLMGAALFLVVTADEVKGGDRRRAFGVFFFQLALNALWPVVFFGMRQIPLAFALIIVLWAAIVLTIRECYRLSRPAGWLLLPYLVWVSFAVVLNAAMLVFNP